MEEPTSDALFDQAIGIIEDIVVGDEFDAEIDKCDFYDVVITMMS